MKTLIHVILIPFKMMCTIFDNDTHRIVSKKGLKVLQKDLAD